MAAFNFPNSPSVNDTYTANGVTFTWNGTIWQRTSASTGAQGGTGAQGSQGTQGTAAGLTIGTSAPGSPSAGDMWWDSDSGLFLTYYNDGNSSQWVELNQGPIGAQGAQGHQGVQGSTGSGGGAGAQGAQGHQGRQGAQGAQGAEGDSGMNHSNKTAQYTILAGDDQKLITTNSRIDVNQNIFSTADAITIYNNSAGNIEIHHGPNVTLRLAGTTTTGTRTLASRGLATIVCVASNEFAVSGAGLS